MANKEPDESVGMEFPMAGMEVSQEFGRQRQGTTPLGVNVRATEMQTRRTRGGSRSGLSKYLPDQVDGTSTLVQHLNVIVDPTVAALPANIPNGGDETADPRNPGQTVRTGGSGVQTNPNKPPNVQYLLYIVGSVLTPSSPQTCSATGSVTLNGTVLGSISLTSIDNVASQKYKGYYTASQMSAVVSSPFDLSGYSNLSNTRISRKRILVSNTVAVSLTVAGPDDAAVLFGLHIHTVNPQTLVATYSSAVLLSDNYSPGSYSTTGSF